MPAIYLDSAFRGHWLILRGITFGFSSKSANDVSEIFERINRLILLVASIYVYIFHESRILQVLPREIDGNNKFDTRENNWLGCFSRKFCASFRIFAFSNLALQQKPVTRVIGRYTIA